MDVATTPFRLTLLTRDPAMAGAADAAGVERIGVDTERLGKARRQRHIPDARISDHTLEDLRTVAAHLRHADAFVRVNPLHPGSADEIEAALDAGADILMLPQFETAAQVEDFVAKVAGRAQVQLLVETVKAAQDIHEILRVDGVGEIVVGLNDLHRELRWRHPLAVAASDLMERIAEPVLAAGVPFGFGGVARPFTRHLPVQPDLILARYAGLGATSAWISRSFFEGPPSPALFSDALTELRERLAFWFTQDADALAGARRKLAEAVARLPSLPAA